MVNLLEAVSSSLPAHLWADSTCCYVTIVMRQVEEFASQKKWVIFLTAPQHGISRWWILADTTPPPELLIVPSPVHSYLRSCAFKNMSAQEQDSKKNGGAEFPTYTDLTCHAGQGMELCLHIKKREFHKLGPCNLNRSLFLCMVSTICVLVHMFFMKGS